MEDDKYRLENNAKLTYEELENKIELLELELSMVHTAIARFLKNNNRDLLMMLSEASSPINIEKLMFADIDLIDRSKPHSRRYENALFKVFELPSD